MSQQPNPLELIQQLWTKLSRDERRTHLKWTLNKCATCGRPGTWTYADGSYRPQGAWCDACCEPFDEQYRRGIRKALWTLDERG